MSDTFHTLASEWLGWRYPNRGDKQEAPRQVPGWPSSLVGTNTRVVDCTTFATWMLMAAYPRTWTSSDYQALQIYDPAKPWSNVDLLLEVGIAREGGPEIGAWHYVQTWEGTPGASAGHARLAYGEPGGIALCLESTTSSLASGPQWRRLSWDNLFNRAACRAVVLA